MPDFLYRYRSVEKLLGSDESQGELAGHYLYFASPEQLNDPFEGYRELYFSGDRIVWRNLFKRYMTCLIVRNHQYLVGMPLEDGNFPDAYDLRMLPASFSVPGDTVVAKFLSNGNVCRHISFFAKLERKVSKEELAVHLRSVQVYAMKLVVMMFYDLGVKSVEEKLRLMTEDQALQYSSAMLDVCDSVSETDAKPAEAVQFNIALHVTESNLFLANYKAFKEQVKNEKWRSLVHSFNAQFIESLRGLSHRDWFTACFMERCSNSAIWGTYGDNHKGVCLKFKVDNSSHRPQLMLHMPVAVGQDGSIWEMAKLDFEKVQYKNDISDLDFFRSIGIYPKNVLLRNWYLDENGEASTCLSVLNNEKEWVDTYWKRRQLSITTKMQDWQNENEYRLILQNGMPDYSSSKNRCLEYDFHSLEGLIFGMRTPETAKYKIIQVVEELCDKYQRKNFNIYQAHHDPETQGINYRPMIQISCD